MRNVVLVGFMGSGKSSVSKALAKSLNMTLVNTDLAVEKDIGKKISRIFSEQGERVFRQLEYQVIKKISKNENQIIACGGGVVLNSENTENLKKNGLIVYLRTDSQVLLERVKDSMKKPLLDVTDKEKQIKSLIESREEKYLAAADFVVDSSNLSIEELAGEIQRLIGVKEDAAR